MGMCGGGGGDGGAEEMRQQEIERQKRIRAGTNAINQIFGGKINTPYTEQVPVTRWVSGGLQNVREGQMGTPRQVTFSQPVERIRTEEVPGQFTDDFFTGLERNYLDYYLPQFTRQAEDADRGLRINLGRTGNLSSSFGARELARLAEDKEMNRRRIIDESIKYGSDQRKALEDTRGNLIGQLESGAGIENVAGQAAAQARAMTAPPAFSPLGDLFKNYTAAVANASIASGDPRFPGAEDQRRALLFNIPAAGGRNKSGAVVTS
jgi:hypothetical protein